ncbi:MAG: cupin domain-containing protein [Myxococcales bacterium]|nr:cupin domain-containing protein [Myxococcales bacterium]
MGFRQRLAGGIVALLASCGGTNRTPAPPNASSLDGGSEEDVEAVQIQAIAAAINEFSPAVHTCWARGAADDYRLEGQVVVALEIGAAGTAKVALIEESVGDEVLTDCLLSLWESYRWPEVFAEGDRIQLPPFDFVAPTAQYSVALAHAQRHSLAAGKLDAQILINEANSGNVQAAMTVLSAREGVNVPLHTHSSAELLFVLRGHGQVLGVGGAQEVGPGSAVYIPAGVVHGFTQEGDETTELVQLYAPGGPEGRFKDSARAEGTTPFAGELPRRGSRPLVRTAASAQVLQIAGGKAQVRIIIDEAMSKDSSAYIGAITAEVGAEIPLHRHANSSEYLLVLEGGARMQVAGREIQVQAGDAIQLPKNVEHGARIVGTEQFKALQFYAPAGPEQRFKGAVSAATSGRR